MDVAFPSSESWVSHGNQKKLHCPSLGLDEMTKLITV